MTARNRVLAWMVAAVLVAPASAATCDDPAHRAFDFWIGEWEVHTPDGKLAGTNRIEREYGGCVLHEHYTTDRGYSGESLNIFDAGRGVWHQSWVDTDGVLLLLEGGLRDGKMVMRGKTAAAGAPPAEQRITWSPNTDGSVRQLWESKDGKGHWSVAFDGRYTRKTRA